MGSKKKQNRGHNEGSIFQRKDGRWEARMTLGWKDGKLQRKSFYGKTRSEVHEKLQRAMQDLQRGQEPVSERLTVETYLRRWLESAARPKLRPRTFASYEATINQHLIPALGKKRLARLNPRDVQEYVNNKLASGLSRRTVQYHHAILRKALNQAMKWGDVHRNVATLVDVPQPESKHYTWLDPEQARQLLNALQDDRLEALYTVAVSLGLRQGEALGLRWQDVDMDAGTLKVNVQLQRMDGQLQLVPTKTAKSRRTVPMPNVVIDALRRHKVRQLEERLSAGEMWTDAGLVFTTMIGTPIDARNVVRHFHETLELAGLPRIRFHDLRHTAASLLLVQGVEPRVIMETLGHSQISLTMNTYSHVMPAMQQVAADRIDELFSGMGNGT